jgi:hypothetical protein
MASSQKMIEMIRSELETDVLSHGYLLTLAAETWPEIDWDLASNCLLNAIKSMLEAGEVVVGDLNLVNHQYCEVKPWEGSQSEVLLRLSECFSNKALDPDWGFDFWIESRKSRYSNA